MHLVNGPQRSRPAGSSAEGQPVCRPGQPHETADPRSRLLCASHRRNDHLQLVDRARVCHCGAKFVENNSRKKSSCIGDFRVQSKSSETQPATVRFCVLLVLTLEVYLQRSATACLQDSTRKELKNDVVFKSDSK